MLAQTFTDDYYVGFQLDKFVGSYGPAVTGLWESLRRKFPGRSLVDRVVESEAYDRIGSPPDPIVLAVMESLGPATMLDLGCGPGTTLAALAQRDSRFRGWGVDVVAAMCVVARARIDELGLSEQIEIIHHDGRDLVTALPLDLRDRVDVLHCKGILNEFFGRGDEHAIDYLRQVRNLFPDRLLINVDYYGKLGRMDVIPSDTGTPSYTTSSRCSPRKAYRHGTEQAGRRCTRRGAKLEYAFGATILHRVVRPRRASLIGYGNAREVTKCVQTNCSPLSGRLPTSHSTSPRPRCSMT